MPNPPPPIVMTVPISSRDSLLMVGTTETAHRGVWFYDPTLYPSIAVGSIIHFEIGGTVTEKGEVTGFVDRRDYVKMGSGLNSRGFTWRTYETAESADGPPFAR